MEYEDAPSGFVTLYNYKEPFMKYAGGFGYQGVLLFNGEDDKVQCHLCGEWFEYLPNHLHIEHMIAASEYKDMVGLRATTALIGEKQRAVLIQKGTERFKNLRPGTGTRSEATKRKISEGLKRSRGTREEQNRVGTCPDQLIERIRQTYHKLGRTPRDNEIQGKDTIEKVYGSWKAACEIAGIPYRAPTEVISRRAAGKGKLIEADLILWIRDNIQDEILPTISDYARAVGVSRQVTSKWTRRRGGWDELCRRSLNSDGIYRKVRGFRYSKEELLKFLTEFKKNNGRNPAISDCKRGLLPHASRYIYYWKSWKIALQVAKL